jgi:hypothetical protein
LSDDRAFLDHLALGTWDIDEVAQEFGKDLGGQQIARFREHSWEGLQLAFEGGIRLEVLQPIENPRDDFLPRFLERSGPGPHHVTFKIPDIEATLEKLKSLDIEPLKVDLSDADWKEAFLHPKLGVGTVVQLAQPGGIWAALVDSPAEPLSSARAEFMGAEIGADPEMAARVYGDLVGGRREELGDGAVAFSWDHGGTLVVHPAAEGAIGVRRLVFRYRDGGGEGAPPPGERPIHGGRARVKVLAAGDEWPQH